MSAKTKRSEYLESLDDSSLLSLRAAIIPGTADGPALLAEIRAILAARRKAAAAKVGAELLAKLPK